MTERRTLSASFWVKNVLVMVFIGSLNFQESFASQRQPKRDHSPVGSVEVIPRIHDRNAWLMTLKSRDLDLWRQMFSAATRAGFPSTANAVANDILSKHPSLPADVREAATVPEFEVEVLRYLATGARNGRLTVPSDTIRSRSKAIALTSPAVEHIALFVIADLRNKADIPYLLEVAGRSDPNEYRAAILALRHMCLPDATKAVETLHVLAKQPKKDFIASTADREKFCRN